MTAAGNYITESNVSNWPVAVSATDTFTPAEVNLTSNQITVAMDVATGSLIRFTSTQVLPTPLVYGYYYYAIRVDATHVKVATSAINAAAGTAIDLTSQGTGVHTIDVGEGSSTVDRQAAIDRAEQTIERVTHDYFYSRSFEVTLDGNGKDRLNLGLRGNILTVTEVQLYGVVLAADYWRWDTESIYLNPIVSEVTELAELHYRLRDQTGLFPEGEGNVVVKGTHGWSTCPSAIKKAAIILCQAENDSTLYQLYSPILQSENISGYSYSRNDQKYLTGVLEADRLIFSYIRKRPMLSMI